MLALTPDDLRGKILDYAAGPSGLNAELTAEGHEVTSCDPSYSLTAVEIDARRAERESLGWPAASESSFLFWNNEEDEGDPKSPGPHSK
jgi:hypothetical protein